MEVLQAEEKNKVSSILTTLFKTEYTTTTQQIQYLSGVLDQLNKIDYSLKPCNEPASTKIINHLCGVVPQKNEVLLTKFSNLVYNLLSRQQIIISEAGPVTEYLIGCLDHYGDNCSNELLRALGAVLYENCGRVSQFHQALTGPGSMLSEIGFRNEELLRSAVQCLENICIKIPGLTYLPEDCYNTCFQVFIKVLQLTKPVKMEDVSFSLTLISALRGLQHILFVTKSSSTESLGPLLAALKVYMLFGLTDTPVSVPTSLYATPMSKYDTSTQTPNPRTPRPRKAPPSGEEVSLSPGGGKSGKENKEEKGGKKARKKRQSKGKTLATAVKDPESSHTSAGFDSKSQHDPSLHTDPSHLPAGLFSVSEDPLAQYPAWSKGSSSESEWSDTEGGGSGLSHSRSVHNKVRQAALGCFYALVKATEKRVMFGFWPSFIPDTPGIGPITQQNTLFTVIMKDPSARARTGALAVLTALVDGNKQYLMAAEDSEQYRNAPFTPFSVTLGYMIKEIHRCLLLCLVSEQSHLAITQIIKCLASFIPNVPYQRLKPGLLTRVIKQIKPFMSHRDPNIRVVCLSCLGSIVSVQAPLLEVTYILNPPKTVARVPGGGPQPSDPNATNTSSQDPDISGGINIVRHQESGYRSGLSGSVGSAEGSGIEGGAFPPGVYGAYSPQGIQTPTIPSGMQTPTGFESGVLPNVSGMSWVVRVAVKNIAVHLLEKPQYEVQSLPSKMASENALARIPARTNESSSQRERYVQPLPVRLESLQVLASMCKGYFDFLRMSLLLVRDVIQFGLEDSDISMNLHSAKLLDELSSVMSSKLQTTTSPAESTGLSPSLALDFWVPLLNGPIPSVLQTVENLGVRSTLCDCLANISPAVFEKLPEDKHMLCLTLLLGLSSDEDRGVRAACVRTLGVLVLYPCLREDVSFLTDAANVIIQAMDETIVNVKFKATWSLGSLTDALVTNRDIGTDPNFTEEFSDSLLLKLFEVATRGASDVDKIRANAIRAVGNLLRYIPERFFKSSRFSGAPLANAVQTLIKNTTTGIVKVRWNACYAIGNMLKNPSIAFSEQPWTKDVLDALCQAVTECKNFKVRINAALALGVPTDRRVFGSCTHFLKIWESLTGSLKTSEESTDLSEFKYRDSLAQQVMNTFIQLVGIATLGDIDGLGTIVMQEKDWMQMYMYKYRSTIQGVLDKESQLTKSEEHLKHLMTSAAESEQHATVKSLADIFTLTPPVQDTESPVSHKSTFVQTYD